MTVERSKENLKQCKCMHCPSYTMGCMLKSMPLDIVHMIEGIEKQTHFEGMFCAFEKSHCIKEDKGCACATCPLTAKYKLTRTSYCLADGGK